MAITDTDIFKMPEGQQAGGIVDTDIFKDLPETAGDAPTAKAEKPDPTMMQRIGAVGMAGLRGLAMGGSPLGAVVGATKESLKQSGEAIDKLGYDIGGAVTDTTKSPVAGYAANVATQAVPMVLGGELAKASAPMFEGMARSVLQSAIKPSWDALQKGQAARAIDTMLNEGVSVSEGGLQKLQGAIGALNDQVKQAIANSSATVNKGEVGKRLLDTWNEFKSQVNPQGDLEKIKQAWLAFRNHPDLLGKTEIPVQQAQAMKQGTYRALDKKAYGEVKGADEEAQKALARGLKEEISKAVPQVAPLNARESQLINAQDLLARRVLMSGNNNVLGLTPLGPNPLSWLLFMTDRSPRAMGALARSLYSGSQQIPANAARIGIGELVLPPDERRGALYDVFP